MSKESIERGLVLRGRPKYDRESSRAEERTRRGRFYPEALDFARLRVGLRESYRRA